MQVDFQKMLEGNLDGGFFIVYVGQSELDKNGFQDAKKKAIIKFNAIKKMVEKYPERIVLVKNPSEVYQAKREEKLFAAIGIENGYVIGEDIELTDRLEAATEAQSAPEEMVELVEELVFEERQRNREAWKSTLSDVKDLLDDDLDL